MSADALVSAVEVEDLTVNAGRKILLGPVSISVPAGEHVLIVGPSGCGKTTLLRAVAGLVAPKSGRVRLFGRLASEDGRRPIPPAAREVGFLFQGGALWPHMTVRRTLDFVLRHAHVPRSDWDERRAELLALVELEGFEKRKPGNLSGGERQRLALARAVAARPKLLLLDEPLGPLDAELRKSLLGRLQVLRDRLGLTILHVTHDPDEARATSGRTLRMEAGRIVSTESHPDEPQDEPREGPSRPEEPLP